MSLKLVGEMDAQEFPVRNVPDPTLPGDAVNNRTLLNVLQHVSSSYVHEQNTADIEWNIHHELGFKPSISFFDTTGEEFIVAYTHIDNNRAIVRFDYAEAGTAYCS